MREIGLWLVRPPRVVNLPCICCYPSCVEVIEEVVVSCVGISLSVEVIVIVVEFGFVPIPLVRGDCGCLALSLIPLMRGDYCLTKCTSL